MPSITASDGPVAVTGASGYVGSHVVLALMKRGYRVHACVTDPDNPQKTDHLIAMNAEHPGQLEIFRGNLLEDGSYDEPFSGCAAVLHAGTAMAYGGQNNSRQVYEGAVNGTENVLASVRKAGAIRRFIYTSSFAAIGHPAKPGYRFTEADWASDGRESDENWHIGKIDVNGETAYAMAKVETEHRVNRAAKEDGGFDAVSVCPCVVLGPLLSPVHELVFSWQWFLGRSPIYYAKQGRTPILIVHGESDPRVHPSQSLELHRHLKLHGNVPVRLVLYPGEKHGNRKAA
ncbi:MAG: NAD-dependent epimerase/dehydratase family protein, partial [Myxococcota bacterium]